MSVDNPTTPDTAELLGADTAIDAASGASAPESAPESAEAPEIPALETGAPDAAAHDGRAVLDTGTEVTFASLDLPAPLLGVLAEAGVNTAFPIQAATIPDALIGRDVLGRGRTGSGKTLAFGLPTLARLDGLRAKPRKPLALVLVPTRELAMQVEEALRPYARSLRLRIRSVYGGAPMRKQIDGLRYGVELLVATPGRLSDLIERGECELDEVDVAILDEADQMCDMGFLPHVCELMDQVADGGQRLLFSATLDGAVDEIVKKYMNDPALHEVDPQAGVVSTMSHHLLTVAPQHKAKVAAQIAGRHAAEAGNAEARSIFFVRTQMAVDRVAEQLRERGLPAAGLHGGMTQISRTKTLEDFKEGRTPVLIATDVAARGIHVDGIDLVVHVDLPRDSKDYLHRAGRTARAGQAGVVASLVLPKQRKQAQRMMDDAGVTAESLDAAPLGVGSRWAAAGAAMAQLTGAREVPEPGDVTPFALPTRERTPDRGRGREWGPRRDDRRTERRDFGRDFSDRRDAGDRRDRDERPFQRRAEGDRFGAGAASADRQDRGNRFDRDRGDRFGRRDDGRGSDRRGFAGRGFEDRKDAGRTSASRPSEGRTTEGRSYERRGSEGRGFEGRGFERRGTERAGETRGFDRRREGDRYNRDDRGFGNRGSSAEGAEKRAASGRPFPDRTSPERGFNDRGFKERGFKEHGFKDRGFKGRDFQERGGEGRGGFDRNRGTDRPGRSEHFNRDERRAAGSRPRSDWDRGAQRKNG